MAGAWPCTASYNQGSSGDFVTAAGSCSTTDSTPARFQRTAEQHEHHVCEFNRDLRKQLQPTTGISIISGVLLTEC